MSGTVYKYGEELIFVKHQRHHRIIQGMDVVVVLETVASMIGSLISMDHIQTHVAQSGNVCFHLIDTNMTMTISQVS